MHDWRKVLADTFGVRVHPVAEEWSMLSEEQLRRLGEDILTYGLRQPIVVYAPDAFSPEPGPYLESSEKRLADGRNRVAALALVLDEREFAQHIAALLRGP